MNSGEKSGNSDEYVEQVKKMLGDDSGSKNKESQWMAECSVNGEFDVVNNNLFENAKIRPSTVKIYEVMDGQGTIRIN